jgi:hypothetical protein
VPLETNYLFPNGSTVLWIVIGSIVTPIVITVLVLILVRMLMKRAGTGLPAALGSAVGGGMAQPTQGTMHVVACSAIERHAMIAPCTIAYAIEAPGMPAFSGQGTFYAQTARWPQPGLNLPVVFDAANPAHVDIDWEHAPRPIDLAAGAAQQLADQLNQRGTTPPPPTGPPVG